MQIEVRRHGIQVVLIEPGDFSTGFTAARKINKAGSDPASPYKESMAKNLKKIEHDELGGMSPEVIGRAILKQLQSKHMAVRIIPRLDYKLVGMLVRFLPAKTVLSVVSRLYN